MLSEDSAARAVSFGSRRTARGIVFLAALGFGALLFGISVALLIARLSPASAPGIEATAHRRAPPPLPTMAADLLKAEAPAAGSFASLSSDLPARRNSAPPPSPSESANAPPSLLPPQTAPAKPELSLPPLPQAAPLPPPRPPELAGPGVSPAGPFDRWTAVYDLTAHKVYLPDGTQLEAHSGLGDRLDDPRHVDEPDRGATPPHLYDLTMREGLFHGVQALRLNPVGGESSIFGRVGLLAHPYMLGPSGDSNGCVSFKDYDAFLQAFQSGKVKRLAVVASLG